MARSKGVTKGLLDKLLRAQHRRSERQRKLSFSEKLRILDRMQTEARAYDLVRKPQGGPEDGHYGH